MKHSELTHIVYEVIRKILELPDTILESDTRLGADGLGIDSVDTLKIVLELENRTSIKIRNELLTAESLSTPENIIKLLMNSCSNI